MAGDQGVRMSAELKPCPFCGNASDIQVFDQEGIAWVNCRQCTTEGPVTVTEAEAIEAWNLRTPAPGAPGQEAAAVQAVGAWQDIATAPKDGTWILLWEQYSTVPFVGRWSINSWSPSHEHVDAVGGWDGAVVVDNISMPVTHWMHMPRPPSGAGEKP